MRCDTVYVFMQFALDELPTTMSNVNFNSMASSSSSLGGGGGSSSFSLNYSSSKFSSSGINSSHHGPSSTSATTGNAGSNFSSSQYADLNKLYCVVSTLLRCYDVSAFCQSALPVRYFFYSLIITRLTKITSQLKAIL